MDGSGSGSHTVGIASTLAYWVKTTFRGGLLYTLMSWKLLAGHQEAQAPVFQSLLQARADQIDAFVDEKLDQSGTTPMAQASDHVLLRRLYLDLVGRIPTLDEIAHFEFREPDFRWEETVDALLDSRGHVSHEYNFWADLLRVQSRMRNLPGAPYIAWLKEALADNLPYDEFVRHLISAEGYLWEDGATGFYFRDAGMELDHMANTFQVFLGTQVVCAQCHDHPYDAWTQHQYYQQAAFVYGVKTNNPQANRNLRELGNNAGRKDLDPELKAAARRMTRPLRYKVGERRTALKLPDDYAYEDARPESVVEPRAMFGEAAMPAGHGSLRTQYASWMTSTENPRFAKVIANRYWKRMMGVGLVEPVDDLGDQDHPSHPELLQFLTDTLVELDFNLRAYQGVLARTKTYRRQTLTNQPSPDKPFLFEGRPLTRMRAEQWWDSVMTLIVPDVDHRPGLQRQDRNYVMAQYLADKPLDQILETVALEASLEKKIKSSQNRVNQLQKRAARGRRQSAQQSAAVELKAELASERRTLAKLRHQSMIEKPQLQMPEEELWKGYPASMVRASELASPAPEGHFLRAFGQSDRETIDAYQLEANVPQALMLLNGPILGNLRQGKGPLAQALAESKDPVARTRQLFMAFLTRPPTAAEQSWLLSQQESVLASSTEALAWMLLNAREFGFVQ